MPTHAYNSVDPAQDESHQIISSYFLGPKAENYEFFKKCVIEILDAQRDARLDYFPRDGKFITEDVQASSAFRKSSRKMLHATRQATALLGKHSIPFWSPRYQGHMCMDLSMPALLGYFMTMLYNPNNVSIEASPITTVAEIQTGEDLCRLFGYNVDTENKDLPIAWGHVVCDGTVANLESMWVARNLKFYPLSLHMAMDEGAPLNFIAKSFKIQPCGNTEMVLFSAMDSWDLLNLQADAILDIPERLYKEYHIAPGFLDKVMKTYGIQSVGKTVLEKHFEMKDGRYFVSNTKHYSWPKSAAITGIGDANLIGIKVDHEARVDLEDLDTKLQQCYDDKIPVYAVVSIMGSTEEGAVDPLFGILALRKKYQAMGLSFLIHGDAAWGGYFCTMLPKDFQPDVNIPVTPSTYGSGGAEGFVPDAALRDQTSKDLFMLREVDSITVDPHKAAYIPYPAGGLCYRDGRLKSLVTFTSPYISRGETTATSIGVFGVEGSKPGASVMSTWFANACIGLNPEGYGKLLSEVTFTCSRLSAEWAAMSTDEDPFVIVPLNQLPSEKVEDTSPEMVEAEKQRIREQILQKTNLELVTEDQDRDPDQSALKLLRALGSDLNINAFSTNWRYEDGTLNDEVEEANYFNYLVIQDISVDSPEDEPTEIPFYLTSTTFMLHEYGDCAQHFKKRLGLYQDNVDLVVMRNVVMSPWPTDGYFISRLMDEFTKVLHKHVITMRKRNDVSPAKHEFLLQGTDKVFAIHFPCFHLEKHRHQLIIQVKLEDDAMVKYVTAKQEDPTGIFVLRTTESVALSTLTSQKTQFAASLDRRHPSSTVDPNTGNYECETIIPDLTISIENIIKDKSLKGRYRDREYPSDMFPFYLFGTRSSMNIDHMLMRSPNIQLSAENVELDFKVPDEALSKGAILTIQGISEAAMQPFQSTEGSLSDSLGANSEFFFTPGRTWPVKVYEDTSDAKRPGPGLLDSITDGTAKVLGEGNITFSEGRYVDSVHINTDPFQVKEGTEKYQAWKKVFDSIGKTLE